MGADGDDGFEDPQTIKELQKAVSELRKHVSKQGEKIQDLENQVQCLKGAGIVPASSQEMTFRGFEGTPLASASTDTTHPLEYGGHHNNGNAGRCSDGEQPDFLNTAPSLHDSGDHPNGDDVKRVDEQPATSSLVSLSDSLFLNTVVTSSPSGERSSAWAISSLGDDEDAQNYLEYDVDLYSWQSTQYQQSTGNSEEANIISSEPGTSSQAPLCVDDFVAEDLENLQSDIVHQTSDVPSTTNGQHGQPGGASVTMDWNYLLQKHMPQFASSKNCLQCIPGGAGSSLVLQQVQLQSGMNILNSLPKLLLAQEGFESQYVHGLVENKRTLVELIMNAIEAAQAANLEKARYVVFYAFANKEALGGRRILQAEKWRNRVTFTIPGCSTVYFCQKFDWKTEGGNQIKLLYFGNGQMTGLLLVAIDLVVKKVVQWFELYYGPQEERKGQDKDEDNYGKRPRQDSASGRSKKKTTTLTPTTSSGVVRGTAHREGGHGHGRYYKNIAPQILEASGDSAGVCCPSGCELHPVCLISDFTSENILQSDHSVDDGEPPYGLACSGVEGSLLCGLLREDLSTSDNEDEQSKLIRMNFNRKQSMADTRSSLDFESSNSGITLTDMHSKLLCYLANPLFVDMEFGSSEVNPDPRGSPRCEGQTSRSHGLGSQTSGGEKQFILLENLTMARAGPEVQDFEVFCAAVGEALQLDSERAIALCRAGADLQNANAQCCLAACYSYGVGVPLDKKRAAQLYTQAAAQSHAEAQFSLGICYKMSEGVSWNNERAIDYFKKAAQQGHAKAQCRMGVLSELGEGVPLSKESAVSWYRKAADQGLARAQYNLGSCFDEGYAVQQDKHKAIQYYQQAMDQGHVLAQHYLNICRIEMAAEDKALGGKEATARQQSLDSSCKVWEAFERERQIVFSDDADEYAEVGYTRSYYCGV